LAAEEWVDDDPIVPSDRALYLADRVAKQIGKMVQSIDGQPVDAAATLAAATRRLEEFGLVTVLISGIRLRPALARFRDPTGRGAR
jgi:hypothetical protein